MKSRSQNNLLLLLLLIVVYWRINHDKSSNLDLFSSELWFCRGGSGVDIVLIGVWRPRLFVLFNINLYVQGPASNNNIIEVKFLSITWAELVIFWANFFLHFLTSGVACWSSHGGIKNFKLWYQWCLVRFRILSLHKRLFERKVTLKDKI